MPALNNLLMIYHYFQLLMIQTNECISKFNKELNKLTLPELNELRQLYFLEKLKISCVLISTLAAPKNFNTASQKHLELNLSGQSYL